MPVVESILRAICLLALSGKETKPGLETPWSRKLLAFTMPKFQFEDLDLNLLRSLKNKQNK